jgi:hypothetical protein
VRVPRAGQPSCLHTPMGCTHAGSRGDVGRGVAVSLFRSLYCRVQEVRRAVGRGAAGSLFRSACRARQEYASGGELFERIIEAGRLPEAEARFYFQQLISGIAYCHKEARTRPRGGGGCPAAWGARSCSAAVSGRISALKRTKGQIVQQSSMVKSAHLMLCSPGVFLPSVLRTCVQGLCKRGSGERRGGARRAGRVPPRPEAGQHAAGRQRPAAPEDLRLWLLQVGVVRLAAEEHGRHAQLLRARGARGGAGRGGVAVTPVSVWPVCCTYAG